MPSIEKNRRMWDSQYEWPLDGDEWSRAWGGTQSLWYATILPRIHGALGGKGGAGGAFAVLEIGCGHGRWSRLLRPHASELVLMDLAPRCVEVCQRRFEGDASVRVVVTDGRSLPDVAAGSVDFVFSFDSLVHAEHDVLEGYLAEIRRVLAPAGAAFLHHSNLGAHPLVVALIRRLPGTVRRAAGGLLDTQWRGRTVSAASVRAGAERVGLRCVAQEVVHWRAQPGSARWPRIGLPLATDAFTMLTGPDSTIEPSAAPLSNRHFRAEVLGAAARAARFPWLQQPQASRSPY